MQLRQIEREKDVALQSLGLGHVAAQQESTRFEASLVNYKEAVVESHLTAFSREQEAYQEAKKSLINR